MPVGLPLFSSSVSNKNTAFMARQNRHSSLCKRTSENKYKTPRFMAPVQEIHSKESVQFPVWWSIEARLRHRRVQTLFQKAQTCSPDWGLTCSLLGSVCPNLSPYPTSRDSRVVVTLGSHGLVAAIHSSIPFFVCSTLVSSESYISSRKSETPGLVQNLSASHL